MGYPTASVVIRAAGERTEVLCRSILARQVPDERIAVVHEAPFSKALRVAMQEGIRMGADWTVMTDADVLPLPDTVEQFLHSFGGYNFYAAYAHVLDKLCGTPVGRGLHFYRTEYLAEAISCVELDPRFKKPESFAFRSMQGKGYLYLCCGLILGIHEYEQSYQKLYIAAYNRALRETREYNDMLLERCRSLREEDPDFLVAERGVLDASANRKSLLYLDKSAYPDITAVLHSMGLEEKPALPPDSPNPAERLLAPGRPLIDRRPTVEELYWARKVEQMREQTLGADAVARPTLRGRFYRLLRRIIG
jgi:hypothetical protein